MSGRRLLVLVFLITLPLLTPRLRGADEIEYFSYLRSAVFDHDFEFGNEYAYFYERDPQGLEGFKKTFLDRREPATGRHINFAPLGTGLLWAPFYLAAHAGARLAQAAGFAVRTDGYGRAYFLAVAFASALYGFLGLLLVHDGLQRYGGFAEPAASWSVAGLWIGTPVLYYLTLAPGFSHAASLFAVALLLWLWMRARARERASLLDWALVGAAGGLAGLVREQDVLFLAAPGLDLALTAIAPGTARRARLDAAFRAVVVGATAVLFFVPQLLAYHAVNGAYAPSRLVQRKMTYASPHFLEVLFDPAHGLFLWSPLLLVALLGLVFVPAPKRRPAALLAIGLLSQVWINGSLESWTQAGAFGSRRFVSATPVFAWGLAALVAAAAASRITRRMAAAGLVLAGWWNVSLMVQFGLRLMDRQGLEWPRVAINQVRAVPPRLAHAAVLFFTDRERLVRESR